MDGGRIELTGPITADDLLALHGAGHVEVLSLTKQPLLTARIARGFSALASATHLWIWCQMTRAAMRSVVSVPGLRVLDVLSIKAPGRLAGFSDASALEVFRCNLGLGEADLMEVATCRSLRELGAQSSRLTPRALEALLTLPNLQALDIEATAFDDSMASRLVAAGSLRSLEAGATRLTRRGLERIVQMKQLRSLDIWATDISDADVDLLADMPELEYLSVGGGEGDRRFNGATLIPRLRAIPSLKRIWLDGVQLTDQDRAALEKNFSSVRIT